MNNPNVRNQKWGLIGAIVSAIVASICCIGPLVLVGLGVSGAWIGSLSAFHQYRPIFMPIAFIFLAFAFYKVYSKPKTEDCKTNSYCANPKADKINKMALWGVTVLVVGMLIFPSIVTLFASNTNTTQTIPTKQATLNVKGMFCAACPITVNKSLKRLDGVNEVNVTLNPPEAVVVYDPSKISLEQFIQAATNSGYPSSVKEGGK